MRILHIAQTLTGGIASYLNEIAAAQSGRYGASNIAFAIPESQAAQLTEAHEGQILPIPGGNRSLVTMLRTERGMQAAILAVVSSKFTRAPVFQGAHRQLIRDSHHGSNCNVGARYRG